MGNRFSYIKYDQRSVEIQGALKRSFETIEQQAADDLPESAEKSLALRKMEEAFMWLGKAIRDAQVARAGEHVENPTREQTEPEAAEENASAPASKKHVVKHKK